MEIRYFLGANSANGFYSHYNELHTGKTIRRLRILKGGPGCGKSTLMKQVAAQALQLGLDTELIPCTSDPDSLDGVVIPAAGYAIVDGTAPHVVEPELCGCREAYLDLGRGYNLAAMSAGGAILQEIQAAGRACYPAATAALRAAAEIDALIEREYKPELTEALAASLAAKELPPQCRQGTQRCCFLAGHTPKGVLFFEETVRQLCHTVYALRGGRHEIGAFLQHLTTLAIARGWDVILGDSPHLPGACAEQLLIPARGIAFVSDSALLPWRGPSAAVLGTQHTSNDLNEMQRRLLDDAVDNLRQAKNYHDLLERGCAPFVDFSAADRLTQQCCEELQALALK